MKLTVVTPPDRLYNNNTSFLLIYPSNFVKEQFQSEIAELKRDFTVYMYEQETQFHDIDWLLTFANVADFVILDIDNCPSNIRDILGYIIANTNTYWLTRSDNTFYNKLNANRIWHLDFLREHLGGRLEKD